MIIDNLKNRLEVLLNLILVRYNMQTKDIEILFYQLGAKTSNPYFFSKSNTIKKLLKANLLY